MDFWRVGISCDRCFAEFALSAGQFLCEYVTSEGMPTFYFSSCGQLEALCGAFMGF
jgi:hypothetical protein